MSESSELRSRIMRAVKSKNTAPEKHVRSFVHRLGYRYRLHRADLPGKPDLVFPRLRKVIFVHGCFWHDHGCIRGSRRPKTNSRYWQTKIMKNVARDRRAISALNELGWGVLVLWECQIQDQERLKAELRSFLGS